MSQTKWNICEFGRLSKWMLINLLMTSCVLEVAQQSKARRKDDFLIAFSPVIAEATATAYKGATNEVQQKLRRVVEVWRQRQIFELPIQEAIESRIDGMPDLDIMRSDH
jgi:regulator of Ty1 transposition protein 103